MGRLLHTRPLSGPCSGLFSGESESFSCKLYPEERYSKRVHLIISIVRHRDSVSFFIDMDRHNFWNLHSCRADEAKRNNLKFQKHYFVKS